MAADLSPVPDPCSHLCRARRQCPGAELHADSSTSAANGLQAGCKGGACAASLCLKFRIHSGISKLPLPRSHLRRLMHPPGRLPGPPPWSAQDEGAGGRWLSGRRYPCRALGWPSSQQPTIAAGSPTSLPHLACTSTAGRGTYRKTANRLKRSTATARSNLLGMGEAWLSSLAEAIAGPSLGEGLAWVGSSRQSSPTRRGRAPPAG